MISSITEKIWAPQDKELNWASTGASICVTTVGAGIVGGPLGAVIGLCSSIADEYLIYKEVQEKHNLSTTLFWSYVTLNPFCTNYLPTMPAKFYEAASLAGGVALSYLTDDFLDFKVRLELPFTAFNMINTFFDEKNVFSKEEVYTLLEIANKNPTELLSRIRRDLSEIWNNPLVMGSLKALGITLAHVCATNAILYLLGSYGSNLLISTLMQNYTAKNSAPITSMLQLPPDFIMTGLSMIGLRVLSQVVDLIYNASTTHIAIGLFDKGIRKSADKLMDGNNGRKLLSHEKGAEISSYLSQDVSTLLNALFKVEDTFRKTSDTIVSLGILSVMAPGIITPYLVALLPAQYFYKQMGKRAEQMSTEFSTNRMKFWQTMGLINHCLEPIKLRDADDYFKHHYQVLGKKDAFLTQGREVSRIVTNTASRIIPIVHGVFDMFFIGYHVLVGSLSIPEIPFLKNAINNLFSFFSGNLVFQLNNTDILLAKGRLEKFFELVDAKIEQKTIRSTNTSSQIQIKDYQLILDSEPILKVDQLAFDLGKTYAITGPSGCGKSSFLIDLKLGVFGKLSSEGEISMPMIEDSSASVMFLDQEMFLPPKTPLLECIIFPRIYEKLSREEIEETKKRVLELFDELEMDQYDTDDEGISLSNRLHSKEFKLSGGQRKKIGLIQAILSQPHVLILDETFAGLDHKSRVLCQNALKKYLPDVLTLVVDHHAKENNDQGYYDSHLHFSDGTIELKDL